MSVSLRGASGASLGGGGGGAPGASSANYKGSFATLGALNTAFSTGQTGWFSYVGPDKYEWNPSKSAWESPLLQLTADPGETIAPGEYASGAGRQWFNDTAAGLVVPAIVTSANMIAAGFADVTGSSEKWADLTTVADEPARLALTALSKPYLRVKQTDTDEIYMQLVQPPTATANWLLVSGSPIFTLQNLSDTLTDGGDALIEH
jgi:hypothetical protein